jgi:hypothetical protein
MAVAIASLSACASLNPAPPVVPLPATATGLPLFLAPGPTVGAFDDPIGRPLTVALQHDVRDILEEAGFKLVDSLAAAAGLTATVSVKHGGALPGDLFLRGATACGVRLEIKALDRVVASSEPEAECVSTSTYYGVLSKDAAVEMVNAALRAPALGALAKAWHPAPVAPAVAASASKPEERPQ